mgnify:CR=1 FL=1|jgi:hypothetical protein
MSNNDKIVFSYLKNNNPRDLHFLELLKNSLDLTPKEKGFLIIDWPTYKDEQKEQIVKILEDSINQNRKLAEKYPKDFETKYGNSQKDWQEMISQLMIHHQEGQLGDKQKQDSEDILAIKKQHGI